MRVEANDQMEAIKIAGKDLYIQSIRPAMTGFPKPRAVKPLDGPGITSEIASFLAGAVVVVLVSIAILLGAFALVEADSILQEIAGILLFMVGLQLALGFYGVNQLRRIAQLLEGRR